MMVQGSHPSVPEALCGYRTCRTWPGTFNPLALGLSNPVSGHVSTGVTLAEPGSLRDKVRQWTRRLTTETSSGWAGPSSSQPRRRGPGATPGWPRRSRRGPDHADARRRRGRGDAAPRQGPRGRRRHRRRGLPLTKKPGASFPDRITIGRTPNNDIVIVDHSVSRFMRTSGSTATRGSSPTPARRTAAGSPARRSSRARSARSRRRRSCGSAMST